MLQVLMLYASYLRVSCSEDCMVLVVLDGMNLRVEDNDSVKHRYISFEIEILVVPDSFLI